MIGIDGAHSPNTWHLAVLSRAADQSGRDVAGARGLWPCSRALTPALIVTRGPPRTYGLTIDSLVAAELMTADGRTLRVSAREHPDLFWAIRGGGGILALSPPLTSMPNPAGR
jgi:hypothetical protein